MARRTLRRRRHPELIARTRPAGTPCEPRGIRVGLVSWHGRTPSSGGACPGLFEGEDLGGSVLPGDMRDVQCVAHPLARSPSVHLGDVFEDRAVQIRPTGWSTGATNSKKATEPPPSRPAARSILGSDRLAAHSRHRVRPSTFAKIASARFSCRSGTRSVSDSTSIVSRSRSSSPEGTASATCPPRAMTGPTRHVLPAHDNGAAYRVAASATPGPVQVTGRRARRSRTGAGCGPSPRLRRGWRPPAWRGCWTRGRWPSSAR